MTKEPILHTTGVDPHFGGADVGGDGGVRQPQVLDLSVFEHDFYGPIKGCACDGENSVKHMVKCQR